MLTIAGNCETVNSGNGMKQDIELIDDDALA
jgi:hypothetical protein